MNFHFNEFDKEVISIEDGLKIHDFEKQKISSFIQQTDEEINEIQLKIGNLKTEFSVLSDKKQELISKLELYTSLSDKLKDNIQRILISTKTTNEKFLNVQKNLNLAKKNIDEKLNSKKALLEVKLDYIEKNIQDEIKSNGDGIKKIISYKNKLEELEELKKNKIEYLKEISNQKAKNVQIWSNVKKNIVKIASEYKIINDHGKIKQKEKEKNNKTSDQLDLSVSTFLLNSSSCAHSSKKDSDIFLKPRDPIWIQGKYQSPTRKPSCITSTPLTRISESTELNYRENINDNSKEIGFYQAPTILIPNLNLTLTPIPRKAQKTTNNFKLKIDKFQISDQIETLDEDPLGNNLTNFQVENNDNNRNLINKNLNFSLAETENQTTNFSDLQFGFKASYLDMNNKTLDSLNLFKE